MLLVKHLLYDEKYTIEGANKRLLEMRREGELKDEREEVLRPQFLSAMKDELAELRALLTPDSSGGDN